MKLATVSRALKVSVGIGSAVVVAGLAVLAAPATTSLGVMLLDGVTHGSGPGAPPAAIAAPEPTAPVLENVDDQVPSQLPEGYVYLGDGVAIPAGGPGDCEGTTFFHMKSEGDAWTATRLGTAPVDMGPREGANGTAVSDAEGLLTYTVAAGDMPESLGYRFCTSYPTLLQYNRIVGSLQPGDVLSFRVDPFTPWEPVDWQAYWESDQ